MTVLTAAFVATAVALAVSGTPAASADGAPPWEPDANAIGTITFYDANGTPVTGGDLSQRPSALFAAASGAGRSGDNLAQLSLATPQVGVLPSLWSKDTMSAASPYPDAAAPASVRCLSGPVASGTPGDFSVAEYIDEFPNTITDIGYADVYQFRLYTSGPGQLIGEQYYRVDIQVKVLGTDQNGLVTGTWDVLYPVPGSAEAPPTPSCGSGPAPSASTDSPTPDPTLSPTPDPTLSPTPDPTSSPSDQ
jgi:hypothetical protein